ncbi:MAG: hypothetical protein ACRCT2_05315, partial [Plesiomonas shigelloides]
MLDNVLGLPAQHPIRLALQTAGYQKLQGLLGHSTATIQTLTYKLKNQAGDIEELHLRLADQDQIIALQRFATYKEAQQGGHPLLPADWLLITDDEFETCACSSHLIYFNANRLLTSSMS